MVRHKCVRSFTVHTVIRTAAKRITDMQTRGTWATIRSPDKNRYCLSANAMQFRRVLRQQLGHTFQDTVKMSKVILVSSFEQT